MKWLTVLFAIFIILISILADLGKLELPVWLTANPMDKVGHFILYGTMTLLVDLTLLRAIPRARRWSVLIGVALTLCLLTGLEEYSQQFFSNRSFDLIDLAASYFGVAVFTWVASKMGKRRCST